MVSDRALKGWTTARAGSPRRSDEPTALRIRHGFGTAADHHADVFVVSSATTCMHGTDEMLLCVSCTCPDWTYRCLEEGKLGQLSRSDTVDGGGTDGRGGRMHI